MANAREVIKVFCRNRRERFKQAGIKMPKGYEAALLKQASGISSFDSTEHAISVIEPIAQEFERDYRRRIEQPHNPL